MNNREILPEFVTRDGKLKKRRHYLWGIWAVLVALIAGGLVFDRYRAIDGDFAISNQLVYAGFALTWLLTIIFAFLASGRRAGILLLFIPLLAGAAFFSAFRLERLDGELRPQFSWRWSTQPVLPSVSKGPVDDGHTIDQRFVARDTDARQFLGPTRNATWPNCKINTDWKAFPPTILWKQPIGEGWSSFAVQGDIGVTMEQRDAEEWVSAYDINDGTLLWNFVMPGRYASPIAGNGPRSTPLIHDDQVFACSAVSRFVCLDFYTGKEIWHQDLNELAGTNQAAMEREVTWGRSGSPLVVGNSIIVPLGGTDERKNSLIAFDRTTGNVLWQAGGEQISYSSPTVVELTGVQQLAYVSASSLSGFEPNTGELLWRVEFEGLLPSPNVAQPIQINDQHLLFSKGYGIGSRLIQIIRTNSGDGSGTEDSWRAKVVTESPSNMRTKFTNPVILDNTAFGLSDGILECIDLRSLDRKWKRGRYHHGQVLLLGDNLLIFAENGRLVLVSADPTQHHELAEFSVLGNVCWNLPALAGNRLLVRNATEAACIQLSLE